MPTYSIYYNGFHTGTVEAKTKKQALYKAVRDADDIVQRLGADKSKLAAKKVSNPSIPKGRFIPCKAVKFNRNGAVSIKK